MLRVETRRHTGKYGWTEFVAFTVDIDGRPTRLNMKSRFVDVLPEAKTLYLSGGSRNGHRVYVLISSQMQQEVYQTLSSDYWTRITTTHPYPIHLP